MKQPMWQPTDKSISEANITRFIEFVNHQCRLTLQTYSELHHWSVTERERFWVMIWKFFEIQTHQPYQLASRHLNTLLGAEWFVGAKLNFAEQLLHRRDDHIALIFRSEQGERQTYTYQALYQAVAQVALALKNSGVQSGDRVVGYLPNLPETVIAMLATTSIGAIWSSCSSDFGITALVERFGQIKPTVLFTVDGHTYHGKTHATLTKLKQLLSAVPDIKKVIVIPYLNRKSPPLTCAKALYWNDFLMPADHIEFASLPFQHPLYILYSSGTTGAPKCIVHGAGGTLLQHLKELALHTNLKPEDTLLYYTTCGWMMWNWLVSGLALGATLLLYEGSPTYPHAQSLLEVVDEESVSIFGTSANYLSHLSRSGNPPNQTYTFSQLHTILSTGSPLMHQTFDFVYKKIKSDVCLSSISGGTDLISCFALGNPLLPVYRGELQCLGLGMDVTIFDDAGQSVIDQKGELVCRSAFPSMPLYFWNDPTFEKYKKAYFQKYPSVWAQGDYAKITKNQGVIIYGRSDTILNPGGVRIGSAEIYRQLEKIPEILESLVTTQRVHEDERMILFVTCCSDIILDNHLREKIKKTIRENTSPRHVPAKIVQVDAIPKTLSGKIAELTVKKILHGQPITNEDALANPECLNAFLNLPSKC